MVHMEEEGEHGDRGVPSHAGQTRPREDNHGVGWCVREVHERDAVTSTTDVCPCRRQGLGILLRSHWMMGVGGHAHTAVPTIEEG